MSRRRSRLQQPETFQDPGKDLFAYLFLLVMVFAFMLLVSLNDVHGQLQSSHAPDKQRDNQSSLVGLPLSQVGQLVKSKTGLLLQFDRQRYNPVADISRLQDDGRLVEGKEGQVLYLTESSESKVLLTEYLEAFVNLNRAGISVAFAEEVK